MVVDPDASGERCFRIIVIDSSDLDGQGDLVERFQESIHDAKRAFDVSGRNADVQAVLA